MIREHTLLTDAAIEAAELHGVRLVEGSTYSTAAPQPPLSDMPRGQTPGRVSESPVALTEVPQPPHSLQIGSASM